ncbi:hypothetical protein CPB85DRAFT_1438533 [Mucidula mucida]|nr:hypothetical protein CPB85DRAFT_1438533 [Mucidula mucida]
MAPGTTTQQPTPGTTATQGGHAAAFTQIIIPMPIAGDVGAPRYNGRHLNDFLKAIVQHGKRAGIDNKDALVDWILTYCSDEVKSRIRFLPEFDEDEPNRTWAAAKTILERLYGLNDKPVPTTVEDLRDFVLASAEKPAFASQKDLSTYYGSFIELAAPLKKNALLTEKEIWAYFVDGIPFSMIEWFNNGIPKANRTRTNPVTITVAYDLLETRFKTDSILNRTLLSKTEPSAGRRVRFDEQGNATDAPVVTVTPSHNTRPQTPPSRAQTPVPRQAVTNVDDLARQMEQMNLNFARYFGGGAGGPSMRTQPRQDPSYCWMCGEHTSTHRPGPGRCDKTPGLINDGLIQWDQAQSKYFLADGSPLPYPPAGYAGGVAAYIRSLTPTPPTTRSADAKGKGREQPTASTSSSHAIGVIYDDGTGEHPLGRNYFGINTLTPSRVHPATRTGKDSSPRFDPTRRPEASPKPPATTPVQPPKKDVNIPPPTNPINCQEGWKASQPKYRITSNMQEEVDVKEIYDRMMHKEVSVPVKDLIGMSPILQKIINDHTKSRREYVPGPSGKAAEYRVLETPDVKVYALNIGDMFVPSKASLPLDYEGTRWSLKGIHGGPERLKGCCMEAPIAIGNHDFPHHLFILKQESIGHNFDLILGQPFLMWFAASIDYNRSGEVTLYLWKDGDRVIKPTISIAITNPSDSRNQADIVQHHHHGATRIEEVPDEDDLPSEEDFYARGGQ